MTRQCVDVDVLDIDVEAAGHVGAPHEFFEPFLVVGNSDRPGALEAGRESVEFELFVELRTVRSKPSHVLGRSELPDQASCMPCGAAGHGVLFE